ncbi:hypothetical protein DFQ00_105244 [Paenibacillus barcinonensis]|uniref:Uncharacterized protein n=1 Tax=Paenibacillus barcinonensis TaxID=198119 RepID=A0A2V4VSL1_PAEBA|nr:hypothetical protein DFQ00_105244 [Paenibacillus barcinonensis]
MKFELDVSGAGWRINTMYGIQGDGTMDKFRVTVAVFLLLITVLLTLNYIEMRESSRLQQKIIEHLYNRN